MDVNKNLDKILLCIILFGFFINYTLALIKAIYNITIGKVLWFTFPRSIILIMITITALISIYKIYTNQFNQNLFIVLAGLIIIYELFIFNVFPYRIDHYISGIFIMVVFLFLIYRHIKNISKNDKTKPKILPKKQAKR